jgi:hypothetical protein
VLGGVVIVALLTGGLSACDVPEPGSARPDPAVLRALAPVTVASAFGDASTVAPCSIVDTASVTEVTATRQLVDGFDDCPVSVMLTDGTKVDVRVGPLESHSAADSSDVTAIALLPKGMKLYGETTRTPAFCDEYLRFADGNELAVSASASDVESQADVCPAADALARNAADRIRAGAVQHTTYPTYSLGRIDPCGVVPPSVLASAGLTGGTATEYPEHHQCAWLPADRDAGTTLRVEFVVGEAPKVIDRSSETQSRIAGRTSVTSSFALSSTEKLCYVATGLHPYGSTGLLELAYVDVHAGTASRVDPCHAATTVAAAVWPTLP